MKHVVLGSGSAPASTITEGLRDLLKDGDEVAFSWVGSPVSEAYEALYGYVLDNEIPFTMMYVEGQKVPGVFRESEFGFVQKVRDAEQSLIKAVDGKVLIMWDDSENEEGGLIDRIYDSSYEILELTNGLAPIVMEVEPAPAPTDVEEEDDSAFTKEQLEGMAEPAVVRYGRTRGCKASDKQSVINELFGPDIPEPVDTSTPEVTNKKSSFEEELIILIGNFFNNPQSGFDSDMAHLLLGQARLWMLKALARQED